MAELIVYTIPVCPFCQRVEIAAALKGVEDRIRFEVLDLTKPRSEAFLDKTRGSTSAPVLELADGRILKESLVIARYLDEVMPGPPVAQRDPYRRAVEDMLVALGGDFIGLGYTRLMNQDPEQRQGLQDKMLAQYAKLDAFLVEHAPDGPFLFEGFGWAELAFSPLFQRFGFLEYFEAFAWPAEPSLARVRAWIDACLAHPAVQQVTREQIIKSYYDYAMGAGNGALLPGRTRSSFAFEPDWRQRPWPPADKYTQRATDAELGLL